MIRSLLRRLMHFSAPRRSEKAAVLSLVHAGLTDVGRVRSTNEDRWHADPRDGLYLVSDGMAGEWAGELASRAVAEVLPGELHDVARDAQDLANPEACGRVVDAVAEFSRRMWQESQGTPGLAGMGATLVLALVRGSHALLVHMGDSRAYLFRSGDLFCLTKDHTIAQTLLDGGVINASEAAAHPGRTHLTRFVGMPPEPLPEAQVVDLVPGDRLLLCTDGLTNPVEDQELHSIVADAPDPEVACRRLIDAANAAGGKDNVTALVVDVCPRA